MTESTLMADNSGEEIFVGDVVRSRIETPFQQVHGEWADYEIGKAPGGYILMYFRSQSGCQLPFGYTAQYMTEFNSDELPSMKTLLWSSKPVRHPSLVKIKDLSMSPDERRDLFRIESAARRIAATSKPD